MAAQVLPGSPCAGTASPQAAGSSTGQSAEDSSEKTLLKPSPREADRGGLSLLSSNCSENKTVEVDRKSSTMDTSTNATASDYAVPAAATTSSPPTSGSASSCSFGTATAALQEMHERMKKGPGNEKPPLPPEIQELTDEFWSKYTPASLRTLLISEQNARVKNVLIVVSGLLFTLPVGSMYLTQFLLETYGLFDRETVWILAAVAAVCAVNIILAVFSYVAYCDEARNWADKQKLKEVQDIAWENRKKK